MAMLTRSHLPSRASSMIARCQIPANDTHTTHQRQYHDGSSTRLRSFTVTSITSNKPKINRSITQFPRFASTSASASPSAASPASSISTPSPETPPPSSLTWQQFFDLRRSRRRYNIASSILSAGASTYAGVVLLQTNSLDILVSQFGLDPFVSMGLTITGAGGTGWLLGPLLGSTVFRLANGKVIGGMSEKEKDFYIRIRRHRADASNQSLSNPVPDYYGEKIGSVADYRRWLKDQRAFMKKRENVL